VSDRRDFDAAFTAYTASDKTRARQIFTAVTQTSPTMSDAWLGRIACGDHELPTLAAAHANSAILYKETNRWQRPRNFLRGEVMTPRYLKIPVWNRATIAMAYAATLITAARFDEALTLLNDPVITADTGALQWRQLLTADLYHATQRWDDVAKVTATNPPNNATDIHASLTAGVNTIAAWADAHLGRHQLAAARADAALDAIDPAVHPHIAADAHTIKGWCYRAAGDVPAADTEFRTAVTDGALSPASAFALAHPDWQLSVTTAEQIATRTNKWDPTTETTPGQQAAAELTQARSAALTQAQTLLDSLIGLDKQKEEIEVWRTEMALDRMLGAAGSKENNMVLQGPPGVGKTTFGRIVAEVLFGLGITDRPDIKEVTEEDIVVGFVSQTAQKMRDVCEDALGGVLFIDEAPRLTSRPDGHSFGRDAVEVLVKYMEDHRDKLVVIVAGYPDEMKVFLDANPGLRSRFNYTLSFNSYGPGEVEQIGRHLADKDNLAVAGDAWPLLYKEAARLRSAPALHGTALDIAGNARFARKVIRGCKRERARRLRNLDPEALTALADTDPDQLTVDPDDMARAIAAATTGI
jgi:type VII secretion ATPase EccA